MVEGDVLTLKETEIDTKDTIFKHCYDGFTFQQTSRDSFGMHGWYVGRR